MSTVKTSTTNNNENKSNQNEIENHNNNNNNNNKIILVSTAHSTKSNNSLYSSSLQYLSVSSVANISSSSSSSSLTTTTVNTNNICPKITEGITSISPISDTNDYLILSTSSKTSSCIYYCSTTNSTIQWKSYINHELSTNLLFLSAYNYIVAGDANGQIHIWNSLTGEKLSVVQVHNRRISSVASHAHDYLLTSCFDGTVSYFGLVDLISQSDKPRYTFCEHTLHAKQVLSNSLNIAASVGLDSLLVIMDIVSHSTLARIMIPSPCTCLDINSDIIFVGTVSGVIYTITMTVYSTLQQSNSNVAVLSYPVENKDKEFMSELHGHDSPITCLKLSTNILVSGDENGMVRVWDLKEQCTIRVFDLWNSSKFTISSIDIMDFCFKTSALPPLQRFVKEVKDDVILFTQTSKKQRQVPTDFTHKLLSYRKQCQEFYSSNDTSSLSSSFQPVSSNHEAAKLKEELAKAQAEIQRWENVNNKLMNKLQEYMIDTQNSS